MFNLLNKSRLSTLLALLSLPLMGSSLMAWESNGGYNGECNDSPECNRIYIGAFGGGIYSNSTQLSQMGTAFYPDGDAGGPLAVLAQGQTKETSSGFGGAQIGYEWSKCPIGIGCSDWTIAPAAELEAYFYSQKKSGHLINPTTRLPEHDFFDTFPMDMSTCLVNAVFSLNHPCLWGFSPYIGGGIGAAHISIQNATSFQTSPPEVSNHFNSKRNDSSWAFAAQAKTGLRYKICESLHVFGEYRYLFVDCSNYIFGSTVYPDHVPTSPWNVKVNSINYNAFAIGIQYDL